jgi:tetratricopeptide (TPR) repeat protein
MTRRPSPARPLPARLARLLLAGAILPGALVAPQSACESLGGAGSETAASPARRTPRRAEARVEAQNAVANAARLRSEGVTQDALAEFERAIEINPELTIAYVGAAEIYTEQGLYGDAEQRYRRATEIEPANFDAQYGHGLVLQLLNRITESVRAYLRALSLRPDDFDANLNVATAYMQLDEPRQARTYAERAVRLNPEDGNARINLGAVYGALEMHDAAVVEYQQAAELIELGPELLLNLADSLGKTGRYPEMASTLAQLVRIEPSAVAHERLGSALFKLKNYDDALAAFREATGIEPTHYPAWNGVGVCLLNRYLWSERTDTAARAAALDALRKSLQIKPNQPRIIELVRRYG